jgi:hypothetical protein
VAAEFIWPSLHGVRGPGFWLNPVHWVAARKQFRRDHTVEWRQRYENDAPTTPDRAGDFRDLVASPSLDGGFSFLILGDTGEGDRSQYGLLPLIRALDPDFIIINGDLAYPAGSEKDFVEGFFQPYQNLRVPIWAVPGNHEYYSPHNGREFFDLFCTTKHTKLWQDYGLRFVLQPGTYWELSSPDCPLVVLALDSGMTASLDPARKLFGLLKSDGDSAQLAWLERRLAVAQAGGKRVLVIFHIPSLVNLKKAGQPKLDGLHGILGRFSQTITGVVTAHEHSFQHYAPDQFARFLSGGTRPGPHYFVSGSGGAFLSPIEFEAAHGLFAASYLFPNKKQWKDYARLSKKAASALGLARSALARAISSLSGALADQDVARYQSLLRVQVTPAAGGGFTATMTPYFQNSLEELYFDQPNAIVVVRDGTPRPSPEAMERLTRRHPDEPGTEISVQLAP